MTVSPQRPQDGNRRPTARTGHPAEPVAPSTALPPVLFQLPNLANARVDAPHNHAAPNSDVIGDNHAISSESNSSHGENGPAMDPITTSSAPASTDHIQDKHSNASKSSFLAKLGSHAFLLGMLALAVTWVVVVAKNVRSPQPREVVQDESTSSQSHQLAANATEQADNDASPDTAQQIAWSNLDQNQPTIEVHPANSPVVEIVQPKLAQNDLGEITAGPAFDGNPALDQTVDGITETNADFETETTTLSEPIAKLDRPDAGSAKASPTDEMSAGAVDSVAAVNPTPQSTAPQTTTPADTVASAASAASPQDPSITQPIDGVLLRGVSINQYVTAASSRTDSLVANTAQADIAPPGTAVQGVVATDLGVSKDSNPAEIQKRFSRTPMGIKDWSRYFPPPPQQ